MKIIDILRLKLLHVYQTTKSYGAKAYEKIYMAEDLYKYGTTFYSSIAPLVLTMGWDVDNVLMLILVSYILS